MKKIILILSLSLAFLPGIAQLKRVGTDAKKPVIIAPTFKKDTTHITKFGAVPDGNTLNTKAINNAIDACSKKGGGVVLVPAGLWLSGPVVLKSNVNLH